MSRKRYAPRLDLAAASAGFSTYEDYLSSDLWKSIRTKAFQLYGKKCRICGSKRRIHLHHKSYGQAVMRGKDLTQLVPVCRKHHRQAHQGVALAEANDRIAGAKKLRRGKAKPTKGLSRKKLRRASAAVMCTSCGRNRKFRGGPCPPCRKLAEREAQAQGRRP